MLPKELPRFDVKRGKKLLFILLPLLILVLVLLSLIDVVYEPPKEVIVYPTGNISDDVFTEQNNSYIPNDNLPKTHSFKTVPYLVDIADVNGADVGSGTVYKLTDSLFAYVAEYSDPNSIQDVISSQFPVTLIMDYIPERTEVVTQVDERGYINGFSAEYIAENMTVTNGTKDAKSVLLGYMLNLPDDGLYAGNHLWIGVGTNDITNDNVAAASAILEIMMNTVRIDEDLAKDLQEEADREAQIAAEEAERAEKERIEQEEATRVAAEPEITESTAVTPESDGGMSDIYSIEIPLDENYEMVQVNVSWSEANTEAVLELFNPEKTLYFDPVEKSETGATFVIEKNDTGSYELRIKGANACGVIDTPAVTAVTQDADDAPADSGDNPGSGEAAENLVM